MNEFKDFRGTVLKLGDKVAIIDGYCGSKIYLGERVVVGFTPKHIRVASRIDSTYNSLIKATRIVKL